MARVTGTVITVERKTGPVFYLKVRDRNGQQIKRKLGPVHTGRGKRAEGHWTRKQADDALRDLLTDLGRTPDGPSESVTLSTAVRAFLRLRRARARTGTLDGPGLPEHAQRPRDSPSTAATGPLATLTASPWMLSAATCSTRCRAGPHRRRW